MASNAEAADLLRMLIDKMKLTTVDHGVTNQVTIVLTESEMDRLMVWGDADEADSRGEPAETSPVSLG